MCRNAFLTSMSHFSLVAHALAHHLETGHAMIASLERGERWAWCYAHRRYFFTLPVPVPRLRSWLGGWLTRIAHRR